MKSVINFFFGSAQRLLLIIAVACAGMLAFALYLQHVGGLEPCPMCVVQRYALTGVLVASLIGALWGKRGWLGFWGFLALLCAGFGAFVAGRQTLLQLNPPEISSCGRDFYGIVENFPISRAIPMLFRGSGDCSAVDWTLLGLSIANWSLIAFGLMALSLLVVGIRRLRA